jgi:hypothetical protein
MKCTHCEGTGVEPGPTFEFRPITTFGGIAGGNSAPGHSTVVAAPTPVNWRHRCIDWLSQQVSRGAALNAICEEGYLGDGVDYESLYKKWTAKHDADPGDCHE